MHLLILLPVHRGIRHNQYMLQDCIQTRFKLAPLVDDEDVPEELRSTAAPAKENDWDVDENHFKRWDWVLDEMIWAFEQALNYDDDAHFFDWKKIKVIPSEFNRFRYGTHLCTLLYSFSFSMVDKYLFFLRSDSLFEKTTVGTEHAHFNYYKEHPEDFFFIKTLGIEGRSYIDMPMKE